jgi:hypothetical protein
MKRAEFQCVGALVLPLLLLSGCAKKAAPAADPPAQGPSAAESTRPPIGNYLPAAGRLVPMQDLSQFAQLYLAEAITRPPRSLKDMPDLQRDMPKAYQAFEDGLYVVCWGADPNRAPAGTTRTVLAYEKATPKKGGVVAFLDGGVRNVTAEEFKGFDKPGAK